MALTKEMIWKAADELDADGTKPTLANVRKRLG
ncbi:DNA-binding protein, partial [Klebsiella pneumoniae]